MEVDKHYALSEFIMVNAKSGNVGYRKVVSRELECIIVDELAALQLILYEMSQCN